jgi:hypothetical protein
MDELASIIKNSFEETIEYLKKNNIEIDGKLSLIILESYEEYQQKYGTNPRIHVGEYDRTRNEVHIIKNRLREVIDGDIRYFNKIFIGNLFTITHNGILWPVYKNDEDIEKVIAKAVTDSIVTHEIGHSIVGNEWRTSAFEFLVYFYKNELYKYPEVYKIMERNIKICERYIQRRSLSSSYSLGSPLAPYSLGSCFANDIIYIYENLLNKDKKSPKINIKDIIEKLRYFSEEESIEITEILNKLLRDFIDIIDKMNCLLEKLSNMTNNI